MHWDDLRSVSADHSRRSVGGNHALYPCQSRRRKEPLWRALLRDKLGNLYGTAYDGGTNGGTAGSVFKLKPAALVGGAWTFVALHYFRGVATGDGASPFGALIEVNGAFYGTTSSGGKRYTDTRTGGTVFSVVP